MLLLFAVFAVSLGTFVISAVSGGGAGLTLLPVLGAVLPIVSVPAALSIGTCTSAVARIAMFRRQIRWDVTRLFVPAALPMALLGALALRFINPLYMQLAMAVFLIANLRKVVRPGAEVRPTSVNPWQTVAVGGMAGFLSGLTGAVGVLFNGFYLSYGLSKEEIVATRATNDVLVHVAKLGVYFAVGLLDISTLRVGAVVAAAAVIASFFLKGLLARLPQRLFARLGYVAMVASGLALFGSSVSGIAEADKISLNFEPVKDGMNAKVLWQSSSVELEFSYDGELEVEYAIPLEALSAAQRALVQREDLGAQRVVIEAVYGFDGHGFEAYYFRDGKLIKRIEFDDAGTLLANDDG